MPPKNKSSFQESWILPSSLYHFISIAHALKVADLLVSYYSQIRFCHDSFRYLNDSILSITGQDVAKVYLTFNVNEM